MFEASIDLLKDELNSLGQEELICCNKEVECRKVADAKGDLKKLDGGLRRNICSLFASFRHSGGQSLLAVDSRLKKMIDP